MFFILNCSILNCHYTFLSIDIIRWLVSELLQFVKRNKVVLQRMLIGTKMYNWYKQVLSDVVKVGL